jgi:hypothetical protein
MGTITISQSTSRGGPTIQQKHSLVSQSHPPCYLSFLFYLPVRFVVQLCFSPCDNVFVPALNTTGTTSPLSLPLPLPLHPFIPHPPPPSPLIQLPLLNCYLPPSSLSHSPPLFSLSSLLPVVFSCNSCTHVQVCEITYKQCSRLCKLHRERGERGREGERGGKLERREGRWGEGERERGRREIGA